MNRQFLVCDSLASALALDAQIVSALGLTNCNSWGGTPSVRTDGKFGVTYDPRVDAAFPNGLPAIATEVLDADGKSDWSEYVAPTAPPPSIFP